MTISLARFDWIIVKAGASRLLTPWERQFIDGLAARRQRLGDRLKISEEQELKLEEIARRT